MSTSTERRGFHAGERYWARKGKTCNRFWPTACILRGDGEDKLSVPCAMFRRCMYAAQRADYSPEQLEVLDAWAHNRVCLIGFSPTYQLDDTSPWPPRA